MVIYLIVYIPTRMLVINLSKGGNNPRHPVIFSADDWGVQSPLQHGILVPLPFEKGDWIPRVRTGLQVYFALFILQKKLKHQMF